MPLTREHDSRRDERASASDSVEARLDELELLYRSTPVGIAVVDRDLRYVRANEEYARIVGRPIEDVVGRAMHEVVHSTVRAAAIAAARRVIDSGRSEWNTEIPGISRDDPPVPIIWQVNVSPIHAGGRVEGAVAVLQDVTRLKVLEQSLQEQLHELESVYAHAPVGLVMVDTELRIVRINRLTAAALNRPEGEALPGIKLDTLLAPSMRDQIVPLYERVIRTGQPALNVQVRGALAGRSERQYVWLMNLHPVTGEDGEVQAVISVAQNITPLMRQQDELEEIRGRLEEAQRMARVGSWEWNITDDVMWWSEELFTITGTDPRTFKPSWDGFFELAVAEDRPKVRAQLDATLQRNEPYWVEFHITLPSLEERVLRCSAKLDRTSKGVPTRLFGTCQDITEVGSARRG